MKNTRKDVLVLVAVAAAAALGYAAPALAQNCTRQGTDVTCDDGRRGAFTGDAIIWPTARARAWPRSTRA